MKNTTLLGTLYIVATPIGNLQDISYRAVETLKSVNWIAAEDTRHSAPLLQHYGISTKTVMLHDHNERDKTATLMMMLQRGESIALISDAGTPLISDPGYHIVSEARSLGVTVVPIPGPCAAVAALSVAGLPTDSFHFEGFLPAKSVARLTRLMELKEVMSTLVFYEAPHRILETLTAMQEVFGSERRVVVARELTKLFETVHAGTFAETLQWIQGDPNQQRGEFVLVVHGAPDKTPEQVSEAQRILGVLLAELPLKQAVELAVTITGQRKNDLYDLALQWKNSQ